jgi:hypothetical protein
LTPKTLEKILAPFDRAAHRMGFDTWEALIQFFREGIEKVGPGVIDSTSKSLQLTITGGNKPDIFGGQPPSNVVLAIDTREKLIQLFEQQPEPTPSELKQLLKMINGVLAHYRTTFIEIGKRIPHDPGGRPVLVPEEKIQDAIRKDVQDLINEGLALDDAQMRIAARWRAKLNLEELSVTTIQRICNRSGSYTSQPKDES